MRGNLAYGGGPHEWTDVGLESPAKPNTPLVRNIARRVAELFPVAAGTPVIRSWAGVVEQTPDLYPIIDTLPDPSNFLVVTTSGHGFGLSPATGKVIRRSSGPRRDAGGHQRPQRRPLLQNQGRLA